MQTAFMFCMPQGAEELLAAQVQPGPGQCAHARCGVAVAPACLGGCSSDAAAVLPLPGSINRCLPPRVLSPAPATPCTATQPAPVCSILQAPPQRVRAWGAREEWLSFGDFSNALHSPPYAALLNCDSWRVRACLGCCCGRVVPDHDCCR